VYFFGSEFRALEVIGYVSLSAVYLSILYLFIALKGNPLVAIATVMPIAMGIPSVYGAWTFSEGLSFSLLIFSLVLIFKNRMAMAFAFLVLSSSMKDQALLYVFPLALSVLLARDKTIHPAKNKYHVTLLILGCAIGTILTLVLNFWRYGTLKNVVHSNALLFIFELKPIVLNALAVFFSPSGGLLLFSPLMVGSWVLLTLLIFGKHRTSPTVKFSFGLVFSALFIQIATLSVWYSPFGWVAWGDRLILPVVVGVTVSLGLVVASQSNPTKLALYRPKVYLLSGLLLGFGYLTWLSLVGFVSDANNLLTTFFSKPCMVPITPENIEQFNKCNQEAMWSPVGSQFALGVEAFFNSPSLLMLIYVLFVLILLAIVMAMFVTKERSDRHKPALE
jgi:hypothetical protein